MKLNFKKKIGRIFQNILLHEWISKKLNNHPTLENTCNDIRFFNLHVSFVSYTLNQQTLHDTKTHIKFLKT
jgi:hypothetical protein